MGVRMGFSSFARSATLVGTTLAFVTMVRAQDSKLIEVASVKPSGKSMAESNLDSVQGRLTATNITVERPQRLQKRRRRKIAGARTACGSIPSHDSPGAELPSIYTAMQQQLGLKLESSKGPWNCWSSIT
jgi:hypothetical protein